MWEGLDQQIKRPRQSNSDTLGIPPH